MLIIVAGGARRCRVRSALELLLRVYRTGYAEHIGKATYYDCLVSKRWGVRRNASAWSVT